MPVVERISEGVLVPQYLPIKGPTAIGTTGKQSLLSHLDKLTALLPTKGSELNAVVEHMFCMHKVHRFISSSTGFRVTRLHMCSVWECLKSEGRVDSEE